MHVFDSRPSVHLASLPARASRVLKESLRQPASTLTAALACCAAPSLCFAHGDIPQIRGVEVHGTELTIATNFGVLNGHAGSWFNTCEEAIGGPLLGVWAPGSEGTSAQSENEAGAKDAEATNTPRDGDAAASCTLTEASDLDAASHNAKLADGGDSQARDGALDATACSDANTAPVPSLTDSSRIAYTPNGVFAQNGGDQCSFSEVQLDSGVHWLMDYSVPVSNSEQSTRSETNLQFALLVTNDKDANYLLRAEPGGAFEKIAYLGDAAGYRDLVSSGSPPAVYATGYTLNPPSYKITYSLDGGTTIHSASPAFDPTTEKLIPLAVDIQRPHLLYLTRSSSLEATGQLWRFDADTEQLTAIFELPAGEVLMGVASSEEYLYVASSTDSAGALYQAVIQPAEAPGNTLPLPAFTRVAGNLPPLASVTVADRAVYLGSNDFTRDSPFLVARSEDLKTWTPLLTIADLGSLPTCGKTCENTSTWLTAIFGSVSFPIDSAVPTVSGAPMDASVSEPAASDSKREATGCDCAIGQAPGPRSVNHFIALLLSLIGVGLRRQRRPSASVPTALRGESCRI